MPETTPLIKAALNLRAGAGFDVYGSHCSGMEECRLRDPPQAENPASQDSFLHNFQVPGIIELRIIGKIMLELEIIPNGAACCKRERCEAAVF